MLAQALRVRAESAARIGRLASAEEWSERKAVLRKALLDSLGGLPSRPELRARRLSASRRDGHVIEQVRLDSFPGATFDLDLHLPSGFHAPYPAVLFTTGHSGKEDPDHRLPVQDLVKRGFAVAVFDCLGRGERTLGNEHFEVGPLAWLNGGCMERYFVHDSLVAMDYLCTRPDVDSARIGCTGVSGGGNTVLFHAALDERVACAVPACTVASLSDYLAIGYTGCPEYYPVGLLGAGADLQDLLCMVAPRPLLFLGGDRDAINSVPSMEESCRCAGHVYDLLGAPRAIESFVDRGQGHGFHPALRQAMVDWMARHLGEPRRLETGDVAGVEEEAGAALEESAHEAAIPSESLSLKEYERARMTSGRPDADVLRTLLGLSSRPVRWRVLSNERTAMGDVTAERTLLETEPGIPVPVVLFRPADGAVPVECRLVLSDHGCDALLSPGGTDGPPRADRLLVSADLRGTGATRLEPSLWDVHGFCRMERAVASTAISLGYPVAGQRAYDALAVLGHVRETYGWTGPVRIRGEGHMAVVAWLVSLLLGDETLLESDPEPLRTLLRLQEEGMREAPFGTMDARGYAYEYSDILPGIIGKGREET